MNKKILKPSDLLQKFSTHSPEEVKKLKENILSDSDLQHIIKKYSDVVDGDMIDRGICVLEEYVRFRDTEPYYRPELFIYNDNFALTWYQREEALTFLNKPAWKRKLDLSTVSEENRGATFENYEVTTQRTQLYSEVQKLVNNYEDGKFQAGLWIVGSYGIGKSYLMAAMAKELNKKHAGVTMIDFNEFVTKLKAEIRKNSNNLEAMLKKVETVDVLIVDDIGAERSSDWVIDEVLYRILNSRHKYKKITCFTSNLTKKDYLNKIAIVGNELDKGNNIARAKRMQTRIDSLAKEVQTTGANRRTAYA